MCSKIKRTIPCVLLLTTFLIPALLPADVVTLRNGRRREGKIISQTRDSITLKTRQRTYRISKKSIRAIKYGPYDLNAPVRRRRKPRTVAKPPAKKTRPVVRPSHDPAPPVFTSGLFLRGSLLLGQHQSDLETRLRDRAEVEGLSSGNFAEHSEWTGRGMNGLQLEGEWIRGSWLARLQWLESRGTAYGDTRFVTSSGNFVRLGSLRAELKRRRLGLTGGYRVFSHEKYGQVFALLGYGQYRRTGGVFPTQGQVGSSGSGFILSQASSLRSRGKGFELGGQYRFKLTEHIQLRLEYVLYEFKGDRRSSLDTAIAAESSGVLVGGLRNDLETADYERSGYRFTLGGAWKLGKDLHLLGNLLFNIARVKHSGVIPLTGSISMSGAGASFSNQLLRYSGLTRTDRLRGILLGVEKRVHLP